MAKQTDTPTPHRHCADGCGARVNSAKSTFLQGHDQRLISDLSTRVVDGEMGPFQRALLGLVDDPKTTAADEFYYAEADDIQERINTINAAVAQVFSVALANKFTSAAMAKWDKAVRRSNTAAARAQMQAAKAAKKAGQESPATQAVFRRLLKTTDVTGTPVGSTFSLDDADEFAREAQAYLGDKTNLKTSTIHSADWNRVYEYFAAGLVVADDAVEEQEQEAPAKTTVGQEIQNLRGTTVKVKIGRWTYDATVVGMNQSGKVTAVEYTDAKGQEKTTDRFTLITKQTELQKLLTLES